MRDGIGSIFGSIGITYLLFKVTVGSAMSSSAFLGHPKTVLCQHPKSFKLSYRKNDLV